MRIAWEKTGVVLCTGVLLVIILGTAASFIPDEVVPREEVFGDGTKIFVLQSLKEAILWPLGFGSFAFFFFLFGYLFYGRTLWQNGKNASPISRTCGILAPLMLGGLVVAFVLVEPYRYFREVSLGPNEVAFKCLYRTRTIPRNDILSATVIRDERSGKTGEKLVDLWIHVTTINGQTFRSVKCTLSGPCLPVNLNTYQVLLSRLTEELENVKKE
jgi:hypothetical protein